LASVVLLLRWQHQRILAREAARGLAPLTLTQAQECFPAAASLRARGAEETEVLSAAGEVLGTLLQTSPAGDVAIGFSGPTNLLLAFDRAERLVKVQVLGSRDTREHVQQVSDDLHFLQQFVGIARSEPLPPCDAVSGATLTSLAMMEAIQRRLGQATTGSLKFPEPLTLDDVLQLFPDAAEFAADASDPAVVRVLNGSGDPLGWLLRTSPAADNVIGYQGPTDVLVAFSSSGVVTGLAVRRSYDNEPYVGYVRDDEYMRHLFDGLTPVELATSDLRSRGVEGVSGATMTSLAVARGIFQAAAKQQERARQQASPEKPRWSPTLLDFATVLVIVLGVVFCFVKARGETPWRLAWQGVVIGYLGLYQGTLLSQAHLVGWSQSGVPEKAVGLIALTLAAFAVPMATKRNVYCSHLCPHGAVQQLALRWVRPRWQVPPRFKPLLAMLVPSLLVWCLLVGMLHWPYSLVDIEPFDAWVFRIAGGATLFIAIGGLAASCLIPMAYCKYGCPTGALLEFVRWHNKAERLTRGDFFAVACLVVAIVCFWWERGP
jgi:uncharacterized protein with FMN-binding domain